MRTQVCTHGAMMRSASVLASTLGRALFNASCTRMWARVHRGAHTTMLDTSELYVQRVEAGDESLLAQLTAASIERSPQPVSSMAEFQRRVERSDTRIFAAFHPSVDGPLAWIEGVLRSEVPRTLAEVKVHIQADEQARVCAFYSLALVDTDVRGKGVASALIRRVVRCCDADRFVTLSPIPAFRKWCEMHCGAAWDERSLRRYIGERRCAVSRFHLRNGAVLNDVLLDADKSPRRDAESYGAVAVYEYHVDVSR